MSKKKNDVFKYLNFALSFGLTLVITLYLLYKGGAWLDQRLGTAPLFMMLGILLALATVFRQLIGELQEPEEKPLQLEEQPKEQSGEQPAEQSEEQEEKK